MLRIATISIAVIVFGAGCGRSRDSGTKGRSGHERSAEGETTQLDLQRSGDGGSPERVDAGSKGRTDTFEPGPAAVSGPDREGVDRPPEAMLQERNLEPPSFPRPAAGAMVQVTGGTLLAGSLQQDTLRVQYAESDMAPFEMTPFEIDALPYPNDPDRPFLTGVTRSEAEDLCSVEGKRLCTELELEWACKSADARRYPIGNTYDDSLYPDSDPILPASPFGVFAMGRILEWSSSAWGKEPDQIVRGVARGFTEDQGVEAEQGRRCAHRWRRMPEGSHTSLGFRCCLGEVNEASCEIEGPRPPFSLYKNWKVEKFAQVVRSIPQLAAVHDNPHMFSDADIRAVMAKRESDREELAEKGIKFHWKPVRWIPSQGMELWVAVGRSNRHSFIVALHEVKDNDKYVHASSLILWDQPIPLALGYARGHREEMYWAPCWGCRDGGKIFYDKEKNEVMITHRW